MRIISTFPVSGAFPSLRPSHHGAKGEVLRIDLLEQVQAIEGFKPQQLLNV
jgi:hypothetical protein